MQLHEFQSKALFRKSGMVTPQGVVVRDKSDIPAALDEMSLPLVVKAQIHAGGRGKAGAIKLAKTREEAEAYSNEILGMNVKTKQTGDAGLDVHIIYLEEATSIASELYLSLLTDRTCAAPVLIASKMGGMDIEETAETDPDALLKLVIDIDRGITPYQCREVHYFWTDGTFPLKETAAILDALWKTYIDNDATMVEINPVAVTTDNTLIALDAKMTTDDNAHYRHKDWEGLRIASDENPAEVRANEVGLNYIKLEGGSIGCLVNGAGLAMATMDVISLYGAQAANFLDVGGGATTENVTEAFRILLDDPDVKVILVNIFGGIMKCDVIAEGILAASKTVNLSIPLVVRLEGTNVEAGMKLIEESDLTCDIAKSLSEAAKMAVKNVEA